MIRNMFKNSIPIILMLVLLNLYGCTSEELEIKIYSDIEECKNIVTFDADQAEIHIYDTPVKDKNLKDLEYRKFFGCEYIAEDCNFEIFAYEFDSSDVAMAYFKNETGKGNDPNPTFTDSSGIFSYRRIVVNNNMAYIVTCRNIHKDKVIDYINKCFSVNVF